MIHITPSCQGHTCRVYLLGHLIYQISLGPKYGVGLIPTRGMECEQVHRLDQEWLHTFIRAGFDPIWAVIYSISYHCVCMEYAWCILYIQCLVDRFGVSARVYSLPVQCTEYVNNMMGDLCQSILCTVQRDRVYSVAAAVLPTEYREVRQAQDLHVNQTMQSPIVHDY